ncbi:MAG: zinc-ribbon domain-containing protein [Promethearchaeota archaeon]
MVLLQNFDLTIGAGIVSTIISIIVAVAISNDARDRGMDSTGYVLLTCCCSWCIGGIVYLIARSDHQPRTHFSQPPNSLNSQYREPQPGQQIFYGQPDRGSENTDNTYRSHDTYRPSSGSSKQKFCTMCGSSNPADAKFCSNCGSNQFS